MAGKKVLVVEDNSMNRRLVVDLLELQHYTVLQAETAEKGMEYLETGELPNLILMDISLPGMDGFTATKILKQDPRLKKIPIVALTAHAMKDDEKKAFEVGCNGYIVKPIDTREFQKKVAVYLS
jgi:CheY-like chemotaxis protein